MSQLLSPELLRAYQIYFKQKGAPAATVPSDILPVVILDDNSKGPYPPYRSWFSGTNQAAVAANFSFLAILNNDPVTTKSCVVVDRVTARNSAADDFLLGIETFATLPLSARSSVFDAAEDKDQQPSDNPTLGNVQIGVLTTVTAGLGSIAPNNTVTPQSYDGPWTLGPQQLFFIRPVTVNIGLFAYFRGRYYASL